MIMDSIYNFNITRFSCCLTVTRRVPVVELEWLILAEYLSFPTVFSEFRVVKYVSFLGSNLLTIVRLLPIVLSNHNRQTSVESASLPQYLGCNTVFDMRLRVTFLRRKTVSLQSNLVHRE